MGKDSAKKDSDKEQEAVSLEQKLFLIDQEIRTLHQCCLNQGYTPLQIHQFAKPLFEPHKKETRRKWMNRLLKMALLIGIIGAVVYYDPAYRLLRMYGRRASIQVLPYWDWSRLHSEDCLIENPYYVGNELTMEDCELCETVDHIQRVNKMDQTAMAEDFLKRDIPVIVTDAMSDWQATGTFTVQFLAELYENEEALSEIAPCMFISNVRVKYGSAKYILRKGADMEISNWYAHWENCEKRAAKVIRQFYKRPYFVPPMVELGEANWIFIGRDFKAKRPKLSWPKQEIDVAMPMIMYAQVKGQAKVELTPRHPCNETCHKVYTTMHEGEMLVVTDFMWKVHYMPLGDPETIAIAAGGFFD